MRADRATKTSFVSAAILAGVTLLVFFLLRDYGPASAVRRFHNDVDHGNMDDLQRVSIDRITSVQVGLLSDFLHSLDEAGAVARIVSAERSPNEVEVLVMYQHQGKEGSRPFVWVVVKNEGVWRVDSKQTIDANPSLGNLG